MALVIFNTFFLLSAQYSLAAGDDPLDDDYASEAPVYDPLEPLNRKIFVANDFLYEHALFPVADTYGKVVPKPIRTGIGNFFHNLAAPVRIISCLMQFKGKQAFTHFGALLFNSSFGIGGILDIVKTDDHLDDEDISQGLASWSLPHGAYIVWPIIGPSNVRNSFGFAGDTLLKPQSYLGSPESTIAVAEEKLNDLSIDNPYRKLKEGAIDPYGAIRRAYYDNFKKRLED